jgi:prefoldin subunit 2
VITAIEKLEPERKCFRLVGGVLVERTVGEVLPAVRKNRDGVSVCFPLRFWNLILYPQITDIIKQLTVQLNKINEEINEFVVKYKIRTKSGEEPSSSTKEGKETKSSGVLV